MRFTIYDFPLPISENAMYSGGRFNGKSRRWKSDEYQLYLNKVAYWASQNHKLVVKMTDAAREAMANGFKVRIDTYFCFPEDQLWTKTKNAKSDAHQLDAANRIKPAHDVFSNMIRVDDRHFWAGWFEKVESEKPQMVFTVSKFMPRNLEEIHFETDLQD